MRNIQHIGPGAARHRRGGALRAGHRDGPYMIIVLIALVIILMMRRSSSSSSSSSSSYFILPVLVT